MTRWLSDLDVLIVKAERADRQEASDLAASIPRHARKQSVVPRQGIMLAVFGVVPKINIKSCSPTANCQSTGMNTYESRSH
jgi:hypothetical protein